MANDFDPSRLCPGVLYAQVQRLYPRFGVFTECMFILYRSGAGHETPHPPQQKLVAFAIPTRSGFKLDVFDLFVFCEEKK